MANRVFISASAMEVFREETAPVFEVRDDDALVGRLTVSVGGVRWRPANYPEPSFFLTWREFDELMQGQRRA